MQAAFQFKNQYGPDGREGDGWKIATFESFMYNILKLFHHPSKRCYIYEYKDKYPGKMKNFT